MSPYDPYGYLERWFIPPARSRVSSAIPITEDDAQQCIVCLCPFSGSLTNEGNATAAEK
jgi:hypothetical protein